MIARQQLPAHSPLSFRALLAGLTGALGRDARRLLCERIRLHWGARSLLFTDSGTSALTLALRAACSDRHNLVALPAYGCYDLATAALGARANVVLYDVDPDTLAPDMRSLDHALEQRPAALVLVHLFGTPVNVPAIAAHAARSGTFVIEDAAQAFGTSIDNRPAGCFGSIAILSFGRGKGLTGGAGGAVLSNDAAGDRIIDQMTAAHFTRSRPVRRSGWKELVRTTVQWGLARPGLYSMPARLPFLRLGETIFHAPREPRPIVRSAVSLVDAIWELAIAEIEIRRHNAARLAAAASRTSSWRVVANDQRSAGCLRLPVRTMNGSRETLLTAAARRLGIIQGYPLPLCELPGFRERCADAMMTFAGAQTLARSLVTLPTHSLLSETDLAALEKWLLAPNA